VLDLYCMMGCGLRCGLLLLLNLVDMGGCVCGVSSAECLWMCDYVVGVNMFMCM